MENLKGYEYNKYSIKLNDYLKTVENGEVNLELCAKLREKANKLRKEKSIKLFNYINNAKKVDLKKIDKLYKMGADLNYKFKNDLTLYMLAGIKAELEVLDYLKLRNVDIYAKTNLGQDALMLTSFVTNNKDIQYALDITSGDNIKAVRLLREHGLGMKLEYDLMGLSQNDYYMGETDPYTITIEDRFIVPILNEEETLSL